MPKWICWEFEPGDDLPEMIKHEEMIKNRWAILYWKALGKLIAAMETVITCNPWHA
jgi:hypothetical protein